MQLSAMSQHHDFRCLWLGGPPGQLCALEQAKAWALREVWRADDKYKYGMNMFIAQRVVKGDGSHPTGHAVSQFFARADGDRQVVTPTFSFQPCQLGSHPFASEFCLVRGWGVGDGDQFCFWKPGCQRIQSAGHEVSDTILAKRSLCKFLELLPHDH